MCKGSACFDRPGYWMSVICLAKLWKAAELLACFSPVKFTAWSNTSYRLQSLEGLLKLKKNVCLFVCCFFFKLWPSPILTRKWMNIWKSTKVYTNFFFFGGLRILEREPIEDRVKLLESNALNCWAIMKKITHESVV